MRRLTALVVRRAAPAALLLPLFAARAQPPRPLGAGIAAPSALAAPQGGARAAALPPNWRMRLDRDNLPRDYRLAAGEGGLRVTTVRAAGIFYDARTTATGAYRAEATFAQLRAPAHPEAYGLFVGGTELDGPRQTYLYFVVRDDGKYLVKQRAGSDVRTLVDWTTSPAVRPADAAGRSTNALRIDATRDTLRLFANGTQLLALPRTPALHTDGVVGLRINHALDVRVDGPKIAPLR